MENEISKPSFKWNNLRVIHINEIGKGMNTPCLSKLWVKF